MDEPLITLEEAAAIIGPSRAGHHHPRRVVRRWCEEGVIENGQRIVLEHVRFGSNDLKTTRGWVLAFGRERAVARRRKLRPGATPTGTWLPTQEQAKAITAAAGI